MGSRGVTGGLCGSSRRAFFSFPSYTMERSDFDDVLRSVGAETNLAETARSAGVSGAASRQETALLRLKVSKITKLVSLR